LYCISESFPKGNFHFRLLFTATGKAQIRKQPNPDVAGVTFSEPNYAPVPKIFNPGTGSSEISDLQNF